MNYLTKWEKAALWLINLGYIAWVWIFTPSPWALAAGMVLLLTVIICTWRVQVRRRREAERKG